MERKRQAEKMSILIRSSSIPCFMEPLVLGVNIYDRFMIMAMFAHLDQFDNTHLILHPFYVELSVDINSLLYYLNFSFFL